MHIIQPLAARAIAAVMQGRNLNDALQQLWQQQEKNQPCTPAQRGAVIDITHNLLRQYGLYSSLLNVMVPQAVKVPVIKALLLVALYQLHATRAAPYAIVQHGVEACLALGQPALKGFVNAVLRRFLREKDALLLEAKQEAQAHHNHPDWWLRTMQRHYPQTWSGMLQANNTPPPFTLRVNLRQTTVDAYLALLAEQGIDALQIGVQAIKLAHGVAVDQLPYFFDGMVSVQDAGAQWAAQLLQPQAGMRILDACAAPGGKTGHLLELADCQVLALDVDAGRLQRVESNRARLQLTGLDMIAADAAQLSTWWDGVAFDAILADVPCSASGVVRRHPDIKWLRRPEDIAQFAQTQMQIIDALWQTLKVGGRMLYATCSVFKTENATQVAAFCLKHADAEQLPLPAPLPADGQLIPCAEQDGFYYALLQKNPS